MTTTSDILIQAVQDLSAARDLETIQRIVRVAARRLTSADGATFVLREGECCFYADEDANAPLWKGKRFPLTSCISGWAMLNKSSAVIADIYVDDRIPHDAYKPTFVRSLAMVPIRSADPIGAIGNYWATRYTPTSEELRSLQALADSTSIAMANVELLHDLDRRVRERTEQLEEANRELEAFSYSVSHDLRSPIRAIEGFAAALAEDFDPQLSAEAHDYLRRIRANARRMHVLTEDILSLFRLSTRQLELGPVDVASVARDVVSELREREPGRPVTFVCPERAEAWTDVRLLRIVLLNLLGNAWKFTARSNGARVELTHEIDDDGLAVVAVRDNGVGFDQSRARQLFAPFSRLHSTEDFEGHGIGLATCRRALARLGGRIWADSGPGLGATFRFTLQARAR